MKKQQETNNNTITEHMQALQQAFTAHVKSQESQIKQMEKKMENKSLPTGTNSINNAHDNNSNVRLDNMEQMLRSLTTMQQKGTVTDVKSAQVAALGQFLRDGSEVKSIGNMDGEGGVLVHKPVALEFWTRIMRYPLLERARQVLARGKSVQVLKDNVEIENYAAWRSNYSVTEEAKDTINPAWISRTLKTNTCYANATVTREFLSDTPAHVVHEWITSSISHAFSTKITQALLYGQNTEESMEGIFTYFDKNKDSMSQVSMNDDRMISALLEMMSKLDAPYMQNAAWFVEKSFFGKLLSQLLTNDSRQFGEMLKSNMIDGVQSYTFLGKPLYIVPQMKSEHPVMLADMNAGYYVVHNEDGTIKRIELFDLDVVRYGFRMRVGGQVIEPAAFVIGVANDGSAPAAPTAEAQ